MVGRAGDLAGGEARGEACGHGARAVGDGQGGFLSGRVGDILMREGGRGLSVPC